MKKIEHLTQVELLAYAADTLAPRENNKVGKHLLHCAVCRDALPAPTPEQFWAALLIDETEQLENFETGNLSPAQSPLSSVFSFFRQPLAWGAGALVLVAGLALLIWLGAARQQNPTTEVARTVETPKAENKLQANENLPDSSNREIEMNERPENSSPHQRAKQPRANLPLQADNSQKTEDNKERELAQLLENTPPAISSLRPNEAVILRNKQNENSNSSKTFALLAPVGETVLEPVPEFRWVKLPNARSYKISILDADFNEVLTAEVSGNSFKPDKPLKHGAKYLWRVAANTDDGEIVAPLPPQPPAVFRITGEKAKSRIESLKKNESDRFELAVFYAQEGMLDSAACALKEILAKNPKHNAARRFLKQVEQWKKENHTATQRCGPSTATKADQ